MTDPTRYLFWITSRAAGTTAIVLASVAVGFGLAMATRVLKGGGRDARAIHQTLALAVMVSIAIHGLALLGDSYLRASVLDLTVPFAFSYKTLSTSLGIISGWALVILGLSYWARARIGVKRWRTIHRFTALAWLGGLVHAFTEGTDSGELWFVALVLLTAVPAFGLLAIRLARDRRPRPAVVAPPHPART